MASNLPCGRSRRRRTRPQFLHASPARREVNPFAFAQPQHVRSDGLDSWKEIAAFLNRTVRTTQRWERFEGLPVYRHFHAKGSSVFAYKRELAAWQSSRWAHRSPQHEPVDVADERIKHLWCLSAD